MLTMLPRSGVRVTARASVPSRTWSCQKTVASSAAARSSAAPSRAARGRVDASSRSTGASMPSPGGTDLHVDAASASRTRSTIQPTVCASVRAEVPRRRPSRPTRRGARRAAGSRPSGSSTCCHGRTASGWRSTTARARVACADEVGHQAVAPPVAAADHVARSRRRDAHPVRLRCGGRDELLRGLRGRVRVAPPSGSSSRNGAVCRGGSTCRSSRTTTAASRAAPRARARCRSRWSRTSPSGSATAARTIGWAARWNTISGRAAATAARDRSASRRRRARRRSTSPTRASVEQRRVAGRRRGEARHARAERLQPQRQPRRP